ncbi:peptidase M23, partial [Pseudomonas sp. MPR-R1B]
ALLVAVVSGKGDVAALSQPTPTIDPKADALAADVVAPLKKVEQQQVAVAARAQRVAEQRFVRAVAHVRSLGLAPERLMPRQPAMGGP